MCLETKCLEYLIELEARYLIVRMAKVHFLFSQVNEDVVIEINSTATLKYFSYQVVGRGDIVLANTIAVSKSPPTFRFMVTYAMAPTAHIVVFYVADDGEVVADSLDIELKGTFQNFVSYFVSNH